MAQAIDATRRARAGVIVMVAATGVTIAMADAVAVVVAAAFEIIATKRR
jgi:hypothetical protein